MRLDSPGAGAAPTRSALLADSARIKSLTLSLPPRAEIKMSRILIVESPAKCSKIQGFLGEGWRVQATMGHIRALKEGLEGIGFKDDGGQWSPVYESIGTKVASLKKSIAKGAQVYIGSDDDREGEAIGWHVCTVLGLNPATTPRVIFHEITKDALTRAVAKPGRLNMAIVEAQQARSMLDMLIGFTLSPCLWKGVGYKPGLSAGRCQTPALRIIYDRDTAIQNHVSGVSWTVTADAGGLTWTRTYETEEAVRTALESAVALLTITDRKESTSVHKAPKPYITSSLQQDASSRLRMNPKATMQEAQKLYEAGHITYMRTDSACLSKEATAAARSVVTENWGDEYLGPLLAKVEEGPHEGIRPTHFETTEIEGSRLYSMIWKRAVQSVMADHKEAVVALKAITGSMELYTEARQTTFAGWRALDMPGSESDEETEKPPVDSVKNFQVSKKVRWTSLQAAETRRAPPSRYTEASLIRDLESRGIGRPSTYASLVETVIDRGYVEKITKNSSETVEVRRLSLAAVGEAIKAVTKTEKAKGGEVKGTLRSTPLGRTVIEWLLTKFGDILEYGFTAAMERQLDEVAEGSREWASVLQDTWSSYKDRYLEVTRAPKGPVGSCGIQGGLGEGYKFLVSKKGPLFVYEKEGEKTRFATVPKNLSRETATLEHAKAAFAQVSGETTLGDLDGEPVMKKSGKFGPYVTWKSITLSLKGAETFDEICAGLQAKVGSIDHQVGPFRIKKGPYGLYMYKTESGTKKPTFVGIPANTEWSKLTVEGAEALYRASKKA